MLLFSAGSDKYEVTAKVHVLDSGITVILYGGEKAHIGSVVVAVPRPSLQNPSVVSTTSSVMNLVGHKDEEVARPLAENLAKTFNQVVVVSAGIHVEQATSEDIATLKENVEKVIGEIIIKLERILN